MAKKISKTENLQEAKERVRLSFRPSEEDPIVRFIGENGKMGLRHLFSEEVVEAPTKDFIDMPEAEIIEPSRWDMNNWDRWKHENENYKKARETAAPLLPKGLSEFVTFEGLDNNYPPFDSLFVFGINKKVGLVNMEGKIVLPTEYNDLTTVGWWDKAKRKYMYLTDVLRMSKDGKDGFVRLDGKELVPASFSYSDSEVALKTVLKLKPQAQEIPNWGYQFINYLFKYEENGKIGLQTLMGEKLTEPMYVSIEKQHYLNGKRYFEMEQREGWASSYYGLLDETGKEVLPCVYDEDSIDIVSPGLITACKNGKYGIFDAEGNPIVKCSYVDGCQVHHNSVITAETSKDVTLFNLRGQVIIGKGQYVKISADKDGLIYAEDMERNVHYIDLWGNHR